MTPKTHKNTHGGARKGAGHPATGRQKTRSIAMSDADWVRFDALAEKLGLARGQVVAWLMERSGVTAEKK
jgi:hypothetical protein